MNSSTYQRAQRGVLDLTKSILYHFIFVGSCLECSGKLVESQKPVSWGGAVIYLCHIDPYSLFMIDPASIYGIKAYLRGRAKCMLKPLSQKPIEGPVECHKL